MSTSGSWRTTALGASTKGIFDLLKIIRCPECSGRIVDVSADWVACSGCARRFPVYRGIMDLRTIDSIKPYHKKAKEWLQWDSDKALKAAEKYDALDYEGFVRHSVEIWADHLTPSLREHIIQFRLADRSKGGHVASMIAERMPPGRENEPRYLTGIDIGCGSGGGIYALSRICHASVGVDMGLRDLMIARKLIDEERLQNVRLICGVFESLQFQPHSFDLVIARDVIEHTVSPQEFVEQGLLLLTPSGMLSFNSPNRYAIKVEPHVLLAGVGFIPRRLQKMYVRCFRGYSYDNMRLLSFREVGKAANAFHGFKGTVVAVGISKPSVKRAIRFVPCKDLQTFLINVFSDWHEVFINGITNN